VTERSLTYGVNEKTMRQLAEWDVAHPEATVVSLYLDLNAAEFGTPDARRSAVNSILSEAQEHATDEASELCVERIRERLDDLGEFEGREGLAVFCAEDPELFHVLGLPQAPERSVSVGSLNLRPLLRVQRGDTWCVLLVNRSNARIFLGTEHNLKELAQVQDDVKNQHKKGGWSQARFERSVNQDVAEHVENAQNEVFAFLMRRDFDHLLVGAPEGLRSEVENELHSYLAEKLRGFVEVDVDDTSEQDVIEAVTPHLVAHREGAEQETVARLEANLGRGELAAAGLPAVLEALAAMRVETLLVSPEREAPGRSCPTCGYLGETGDTCPLDGTALDDEEDVIGRAVQAAFMQSASVVDLTDREALADHDGIAAILRY
jgi:peptide chain release factor subunit 1